MKEVSIYLCLLLVLGIFGCYQQDSHTNNTSNISSEDSLKRIKLDRDTGNNRIKSDLNTKAHYKERNPKNETRDYNKVLSNQFWNSVSFNYNHRLMNAGMRSWLHQIAEKETGTFTGAIALLKNIENEPDFQNKVLLAAYSDNKENFRMILSTMCGSFSIGNPMADYIYQQHKHNVSNKITEQED